MGAFCIDLGIQVGKTVKTVPLKNLEILELTDRDLALELRDQKVTTAKELTDWDRMVFDTEAEAEKFLETYKTIYNNLEKYLPPISTAYGPALMGYRRTIIQILISGKRHTDRGYRREWEPGQVFKITDRTFSIEVKLLNIEKIGKIYRYHFTLP